MIELQTCIDTISNLLPDLEKFIGQFNATASSNGINVITDSWGTMSIDGPASMSDYDLHIIAKRISVIDRLVNTTGQSINEQFQQAFSMKEVLYSNPIANSTLQNQLEQFKALNVSYKH